MAVSAQCSNGTHKRGPGLHGRESARESGRDTGREASPKGGRNRLFWFVAHGVNHHEITDAARRFAMVMRKSRDRPRPLGRCNYVGRLALRHCVHLAVWLFHQRPKTSAGGDRGRCRLRRTERYAQFDRRYNTIENITAALLPLSLSLDRSPCASPPRYPFSVFYFSFSLSLSLFLFFSLHSRSGSVKSRHFRRRE